MTPSTNPQHTVLAQDMPVSSLHAAARRASTKRGRGLTVRYHAVEPGTQRATVRATRQACAASPF